MQPGHTFSLGAIILAAGRSRRMGRPKLLLPWADSSIVGHLLSQWAQLGATNVVTVIAADDDLIGQELDRLVFPQGNRIPNPAPENGMFCSIQCAARWVSSGRVEAQSHYALVLGDQPHLQARTLRDVVVFAAQHPSHVCQPAYQGRARHPVLMPRSFLDGLAASKANTLREALSDAAVLQVECDDPGLDLDVDTPADYERAIALARLDT